MFLDRYCREAIGRRHLPARPRIALCSRSPGWTGTGRNSQGWIPWLASPVVHNRPTCSVQIQFACVVGMDLGSPGLSDVIGCLWPTTSAPPTAGWSEMSPGGAATPWLDSGPQAVVASCSCTRFVRTHPCPKKLKLILAGRLRLIQNKLYDWLVIRFNFRFRFIHLNSVWLLIKYVLWQVWHVLRSSDDPGHLLRCINDETSMILVSFHVPRL